MSLRVKGARRALVAAGALILAAPAAGGAAGIDGPGTYYVFRTFDTGVPFTAEQQARCNEHFGTARGETGIDLNATLWSLRIDPASGRVTNQKEAYLGPAFGCLAPAADVDLLELAAWSPYTPPNGPVAGVSYAAGTCPPSPTIQEPGSVLLNCQLSLRPDPQVGVVGGLATSNSLNNPRNLVPGVPTGSLWTSYVVTEGDVPLPPPMRGTPLPTPEPLPGVEFFMTRTSKLQPPDAPLECPPVPLLATVIGSRSAALSAVEPDATDGRVVPERGRRTGAMRICFTGSDPARRTAVARLHVTRNGRTIELIAQGDCRDHMTAAGTHLRQQTCNLSLQSSSDPQISAAKLTSNGLVPAGAPLTEANSHIWTLALFV